MSNLQRHRFTLRFFDPDLERAFLDAYVSQSFKQVRWTLVLGVVMYGVLFGLLDLWTNIPQRPVIWMIRTGVCVVALGVFGITFTPSFKRLMQPLLGGTLLIAGLGLVAMMAIDQSGAYRDGPALLVLSGYVMLRLRYTYASVVGGLIMVAYEAVLLGVEAVAFPVVLSSSFFLISANIIGMFAGFALEAYARTAFGQARLLDEKRQENERLLQVKSRFFDNMSHEFRTPLTLIIGPLEDLLDRSKATLPAPVRQVMSVIYQNAQRLLRLINELLDLSKLEADSTALRVRRGDLVPWLERLAAAFSSHAEQRKITLLFEPEADHIVAAFDAEKLDKVFINLLSNAFKFTPEGGTVRLRVAAQAHHIEIRVKDTGPGIPPAILPTLFDRFQQGSWEAATTQAGTGIGLALVKALLDQHRGQIRVESEVGFGSEFIVTLPRGLEIEEAASMLPTHEEPPRLDVDLGEMEQAASEVPFLDASPSEEAPLVLLVDDHREMRAYLRACLAPDYQVLEAADGAEGLAQAGALVPDLIITDVMMPVMDGHAFCRALRADDVLNHIPVIMLTAKASPLSEVAGLETGADDYLVKPFNAGALRARVERLIARQRQLRARFSREVVIQPGDITVSSAEEAFIQRAREVVENHLSDVHFNVDAFSEALGMSLRQLQRKLSALTGLAPKAFIRTIRLQRAAQLLEKRFGTVAEVAYAVGFNNPTYFTKCFREAYGVPPSGYLGSEEVTSVEKT